MKKGLYVCCFLVAITLLIGCDVSGVGGTYSALGGTTISASSPAAGGGAAATGGGAVVVGHSPEPGSLLLMASGLMGCAAMFFKKFKR